MDMKYFTAESKEAAEELAAGYFSCSMDKLRIEVIKEGKAITPWLILAIFESNESLANLDGFFKVFYEGSGVYLEIYGKRGGGKAVSKEDVLKYLKRKKVNCVNDKEVLSLLAQAAGRAKIAPSQEEEFIDEDIDVVIPVNEMSCMVTLLQPEPGGAMLTEDIIKQKLSAAGVRHGLKEDVISRILEEREYDTQYTVAESTMPEDGEDGVLVFHFKTSKIPAPRELASGKVDYRMLDIFEPVKDGQLLVTRQLATPGKPGCSVKGTPLKQKPGKEARMPQAKNAAVNEDRTTMHAQRSGMVEYVEGAVVVSDVYKVKGDCDFSVGNIDFDGSVIITGNVMSGLTIKASGGISVEGVVEAAELIAGGSVELRRGMQGMDKGRITASGSVTAMFLQSCTVIAGGDVSADAIMHSVIEAGGSVMALGRRGNIIGGTIRATDKVITSLLGSVSHAQTEVEVGLVPQKRNRIQYLEEELAKLNEEIDKLDKIEAYLDKAGVTMPPENLERIRVSTAASKKLNVERLEEYTEELEVLKAEMENAVNGKVHVYSTIFTGVRISISTGVYRVNKDMEYSTFKYRKGEIVFSPCEA